MRWRSTLGGLSATTMACAMVGRVAADGYFVDGNALHEMCERFPVQISGFAIGYLDAMSLRDEAGSVTTICVPVGVKAIQARDVLCAYLRNNPQHRHWQGAYLALSSFQEAWPCEQ